MSKEEIKRILVPLDGSSSSEKGLNKAIYIAKLTGAEITGLNVIIIYPTLASTVVRYKKLITEKSEKMLETIKQACEKQGVKFTGKILYGKPSTKISEYAQKEKFDIIIIGSRGLSGLKRTMLGSISSATVQKSKVSVLIVK